MPGFDIKALADLGGWAVAVGILSAVVGLLITGRIVPGSVVESSDKRLDAIEKSLREDITPVIREIAKGTQQSGTVLEFLAAFVRDVARERRDREDR